jgi:hypothetical protein
VYAFILTAALCQFDVFGSPEPASVVPFDVWGDVPQVVAKEIEEDEPPEPPKPAVVDLRSVFVYLDLDDSKSYRIREDTDQIEGLIFKFRDGSRVPEGGEKYDLPLLHYHTDSGWVFDSGWKGALRFAQRWSRYNSDTELLVENAGVPVGKDQADAVPGGNGQSQNGKALSSVPVVSAHYPVRGSWWTGCGSWRHMTQGQHAGKFDANWLRSLSNAEIQSLHSDDHEGRVKWHYVNRQVAAAQPRAFASPRYQTFCPSGFCPWR